MSEKSRIDPTLLATGPRFMSGYKKKSEKNSENFTPDKLLRNLRSVRVFAPVTGASPIGMSM